VARKQPNRAPSREAFDRQRPGDVVDRTQDCSICLRPDQIPDENRSAAGLTLDGVGDVVGSDARSCDRLQSDIAVGDSLAIGQLADRVGQRPPAAKTGVDRQIEPQGEPFRTGRVVRVDVGQRDRHDLPA
jgi:hypothetical protein